MAVDSGQGWAGRTFTVDKIVPVLARDDDEVGAGAVPGNNPADAAYQVHLLQLRPEH